MAQKFSKESVAYQTQAKSIAEESAKTERDRKKIAKLLEDAEKLHTKENLEKAKQQNRERLYRQNDRLPLDQSEGLFDANQNPEQMSARVKKMADTIRDYLESLPTQVTKDE
jgi:small-conductance mechanosensitive channel